MEGFMKGMFAVNWLSVMELPRLEELWSAYSGDGPPADDTGYAVHSMVYGLGAAAPQMNRLLHESNLLYFRATGILKEVFQELG